MRRRLTAMLLLVVMTISLCFQPANVEAKAKHTKLYCLKASLYNYKKLYREVGKMDMAAQNAYEFHQDYPYGSYSTMMKYYSQYTGIKKKYIRRSFRQFDANDHETRRLLLADGRMCVAIAYIAYAYHMGHIDKLKKYNKRAKSWLKKGKGHAKYGLVRRYGKAIYSYNSVTSDYAGKYIDGKIKFKKYLQKADAADRKVEKCNPTIKLY